MIESYLATSVRFLLLGCLLATSMALLYRLLRGCKARDSTAAGYAFLLPWLVGTALLVLLPMGLSLLLSFTRYSVLQAPQWAGLEHYRRIFSGDPIFLQAAGNTVLFAVFAVGLGILSSLAAAMLMSLDARGMGLFRAVVYLPSVIPAVSTALLWRWIFAPNGLANSLLELLGVSGPGWFHDPDWVIPAFVIMSLQGACGNNMVIFLARIRSVDVQIHEAAALDGAGLWARFRHITLPQISPVIFYHLVTGVIGSLMIFTQPMFIQTPGRSGLFYVPYIYRTGWAEGNMGYACALSWVLFVALMLLTMLLLVSSKRWVHYESQDVLISRAGRVLKPGRVRKALWMALVVLFSSVMLVPIAWMVSTSLKSPGQLRQVLATPAGALRHFIDLPLHLENYPDAWQALPFWRFVLNSLFVAALAIGGELLSASLAAYGFARLRFRGRRVLFGVLLATLMIPPVVMIVPVFLIWTRLGLVGTFDPLVLSGLLGGGGLYVFILHQFFKTLPPELEEAARLDGASHGRIFFRIIVPQCIPVFLVVFLISFQAHWNDYLGPLLYLEHQEQYTMTLGLQYFQKNYLGRQLRWHWLMAITTLMALPTVLIFLLTQRSFFVSGRNV
jgi:multiple sugar transport system permease protein